MPSPAHFSSTQVVKRKPTRIAERGGVDGAVSAGITPTLFKQRRQQIVAFFKRLRSIKRPLDKRHAPQKSSPKAMRSSNTNA